MICRRCARRNLYVDTMALAARLRQVQARLSRMLCSAVAKQPGLDGEHRPVGALARKIGMMSLWDANGTRHPITVLCVDRCHVLQVKEPQEKDMRRRWAVQVGAGPKRPYKTNKAQRYHCAKAGVEPKQKIVEFLVDKMFVVPVGTEIRAAHFAAGQYVDVTGTSIGKGTQGVMKRWGFAGGSATHGNSKAHRSAGSTGMSTKPGRVFKGKKMAGRMGNKRVTTQSLLVYKVDAVRNLVYIRGAVPGNAGGWVRIRDGVRKLSMSNDAPMALRESTEDVEECLPRVEAQAA